ncbi:MAG: hypothetical protein HZB91_00875 [Elusimicrobia bacterium]|nr:hypothetical protein [Elusimicrobiota bacterium]
MTLRHAKTKKSQRGQTLVAALMLVTIALITVPLLVMHVQNEAKWTVKQARSSAAYHLAEAGQDRAVFLLVQSTANWADAIGGTAIPGFNGDTQYSDVAGGLYTIKITSGPLTYEATVLTKGRDSSSQEVRTIKAIYSGAALLSGWIARGAMDYQSTFVMYWGQVTSYTSIAQVAAPPYHPIKVSKGAITPWDSSPTPPNQDSSKSYSAYDPSLTDPPTPDFAYYRTKAKATRAPDPATIGGGDNGGQTAPWRGTGYFDGGSEAKFKNYTFDCSTCVFFFENGKAKTEGTGYLRLEALLVIATNMGIHIHATGKNPYVLSVPTDSWKQYVAGTVITPNTPDSAATNQYPGDGGLNTVQATYSIPTAAFDGATNTGMAFHGFLYSYKFDCNGGVNSNVGTFLIGPGGSDISTMIIYFDPAVAGNVHYTKSQISRASWDEITASWP